MIDTDIPFALQQLDLLSVIAVAIPIVIIILFLWNVDRLFPTRKTEK